MGCCGSSSPSMAYDPQMSQDQRLAMRLQAEEDRVAMGSRMPRPQAPAPTLLGRAGARQDWGAPQGGKRLGGGDAAAGGAAADFYYLATADTLTSVAHLCALLLGLALFALFHCVERRWAHEASSTPCLLG
mmetsp:Transcript_7194/g.14208  ORF Transcript_7194/g.14208 Transcript_7194/m.14208 type:complete len:131 (-) Transcript_7194:86-478(-)